MNPKKILYIIPNGFLGGAERLSQILIQHHDRSKYIPAVAFLRDGPLVHEFKNAGIEVFLMPKVRLREIWKHHIILGTLQKIVEQGSFDLIHSTMAYAQFFGGRVAKKKNIKNSWFQHGPVGSVFDWFVSRIKTDAIFTNSLYTAHEQKKLSPGRTKIITVYGAVELPMASSQDKKQKRKNFRAQWGVGENHTLIGHVGRLQEWKGQLQALQGLREVIARDPTMHGVFVGSADLGSSAYEEKLKRFTQENGLGENIHFAGFVKDMSEVYAGIDILIHTSLIPEPFGLTIIEAMAHNVPVIASPHGGPKEIIIDNVNGAFWSPLEPLRLPDLIRKFKNPTFQNKITQAASAMVTSNFSSQAFVSRIEKSYDEFFK